MNKSRVHGYISRTCTSCTLVEQATNWVQVGGREQQVTLPHVPSGAGVRILKYLLQCSKNEKKAVKWGRYYGKRKKIGDVPID